MAIVSRGLGQPEAGAIVTAGLGASETDPNAITAHLFGVGTLTADLTAASGDIAATLAGTSSLAATLTSVGTATQSAGGKAKAKRVRGRTAEVWPERRPPKRRAGELAASLSGSSALVADLGFEFNPSDADFELLLMLEVV